MTLSFEGVTSNSLPVVYCESISSPLEPVVVVVVFVLPPTASGTLSLLYDVVDVLDVAPVVVSSKSYAGPP
jgi:hypothetical protein